MKCLATHSSRCGENAVWVRKGLWLARRSRGAQEASQAPSRGTAPVGRKFQDHDLVFCREDGIPLDRWQVRREFAVITKEAGLGEEWAPRELWHSFVSIICDLA